MKRRLLPLALALLLMATTVTHAQQAENKGNNDPDTSCIERTVTTPHHYDVVPGTDAWRALKNAPEKRAACFVSAKEAASMTTPTLIKTILDYPLLIDTYAYDNYIMGMKAVSNYFPCINELVGRRDAYEIINQLLQEDDESDPLISLYLETLRCYLVCNNNDSDNAETPTRYTNVTVYTPNGTAVTAHANVTYADYTAEDGLTMTYQRALSLHYAYTSAYNVVVLAGISPSYNCHAYAWYSQTSTSLCIAYPSDYITDGSYILSTRAVGRKITYQNPNSYAHSGIVDTATNSNSTTKIVSKWGCTGLYKHYVDDCPYYHSYSTLKFWRLNQ